ncbi:MAG: alpha/beta hydrolase [Pyrinomonadaceae bacterium]
MSSRQTIHFAPANSFPARSYDKLFALLKPDFDVGFLKLHAHNPQFPVTNNWKYLAEELKTEIKSRYAHPVIGVGHSLGGILHFLVAVENPELYSQIILLDAPLTSRLSGAVLKNLKRFGLMNKFSPSKIAVRRRREWQSKQAAVEHFERKFRFFDKDIIRDYVEHGTTKNMDGSVQLLFKPEIEAAIYRTIPDDYTHFRGKLRVPAFYIGGTRSREAWLARLGFMRRNFPFKFYFIEGSHHFPFESPAETVRVIRRAIQELDWK